MRFKKVYIEITNVCNLNCSFCAKNERKAGYMSVENFAYVLKQLQPYTNYIYLHVLGEPLLHPQLRELLEIARSMSMHVNMTSNAVLLKEKLPILEGRIRQLNLSLHSKPKQGGIHADSYVEDCLAAGDHLAQAGTYVSYRLWNMKEGLLDEESLEVLQCIEAHYQVKIELGKKTRLAERRFLHFEEEFAWPSLKAPQLALKGSCYGMRSMCGILVDGSVVPCCLDSRGDCVLGNLFTTPFKDIVESERAQKMREGFSRQDIVEELCQRCGYRTRFDEGGTQG